MWISLVAIAVTLFVVVMLMTYVPVWWAKITRRPNAISKDHHRRREAHARYQTERAAVAARGAAAGRFFLQHGQWPDRTEPAVGVDKDSSPHPMPAKPSTVDHIYAQLHDRVRAVRAERNNR